MITFRQTAKDDIPILSEILTVVSFDIGSLSLDEPSIAGWAACIDDKPVGFSLANREDGRLLVVAVTPELAGKGIARELMRQAEAWLFSHGWNAINLTIPDEEYRHAIDFFLHLGWEHSQEERDFLFKKNPRTLIQLEEHCINDPETGYSRLVRLQRGPADKPTLCVSFWTVNPIGAIWMPSPCSMNSFSEPSSHL